ncbi:hypothetical protein ACI2I2_06445 [Scandinavium sp. NPDC088450]|uniref:hypothetical protein n=1 Tax=Scandinavium sp. NPDC088450 TaxID=3364514 RepID=UPI00384F00BD
MISSFHLERSISFNCQRVGKAVLYNRNGFVVDAIHVYVIASSDPRVIRGTMLYLCDALSGLIKGIKYTASTTLLTISLSSRRKRKVSNDEFLIRDNDFIILSQSCRAVEKRSPSRKVNPDKLDAYAETIIKGSSGGLSSKNRGRK